MRFGAVRLHDACSPRRPLRRLARPIALSGQSEPQKIFDRHASLNDTQIINYKTSPDEKWMVLIGIKSEVTRPRRPRPCLPARTRRTTCADGDAA